MKVLTFSRLQGDLLYEAIPTSPASDIFFVNSTNGEIRIRNSALLRSDRSMQYMVRVPHPNLAMKNSREQAMSHETFISHLHLSTTGLFEINFTYCNLREILKMQLKVYNTLT